MIESFYRSHGLRLIDEKIIHCRTGLISLNEENFVVILKTCIILSGAFTICFISHILTYINTDWSRAFSEFTKDFSIILNSPG